MASASACRVVERLAVVVPPVGCPDLHVVARADHDGVAARPTISRRYAGTRTGPGRRASTAVAPAKMNREKRRAPSSVIGRVATLSARASQPAPGVDREAGVEPARDDETRVQLGAEFARDGDPSLVVHRVPVLAGEHLSGSPLGCGA